MNIKGDLFGGITAGIIALPLALAFGVASGAGAVAGLYGAIVLGFFASLFGGTKTQISGPTGPMSVVFASVVLTFSHNLQAIALVVLLAGIFQILLGVFGVGKFVKYMPYPVISGFMSGIGVIIIILQINPSLGVEANSSIIQTLTSLHVSLQNINFEALFVMILSLCIMFFTPKKITSYIPSPLLALIVVSAISIIFDLHVSTIGEIPNSLPSFIVPSFNVLEFKQIISFAITLALLGTIDTLLTSLVADSITKTKHNPTKELIGQGVGNALVSFIGGLPGAGATMRTVINVKSGGKTQLSGIFHSIFLLLVILFLSPLASQIPLALLSGILIKVGIDILDYKFLKIIKNAPKYDLVIMLVVFFLTVFVDLIMAVGVGITLASLLTVYRITKQTQINLVSAKDTNKNINHDDILLLDIQGAFFFGSASFFVDLANTILNKKEVIINCSRVPFMDLSAIFALEDIILRLKSQNMQISLVLNQNQIDNINKIDKMNTFKSTNIYENLDEAIKNSKFIN